MYIEHKIDNSSQEQGWDMGGGGGGAVQGSCLRASDSILYYITLYYNILYYIISYSFYKMLYYIMLCYGDLASGPRSRGQSQSNYVILLYYVT